MSSYLQIALEKSVRLRAMKMSVIVGCILATINHGDNILNGTAETVTFIKVLSTFFVPYCVSTISSVLVVLEHQQTFK